MSLQSASCHKCGREASEYTPGKWQCLHCGRKFIYEPEQPTIVHQHINNYVIDGYEVETESEPDDIGKYSGLGYLYIILMFVVMGIGMKCDEAGYKIISLIILSLGGAAPLFIKWKYNTTTIVIGKILAWLCAIAGIGNLIRISFGG